TEQPLAGSMPAVISTKAFTFAGIVGAGLAPPTKLSLRKLEAFPRALLPVLLAFLHTGIARQKSVLPQRRPQLRVILRDRSRQSHPHRSGLPANPAAMRGHLHVHLVSQVRELQRLDRIMLPRMIRKIIRHLAPIDRE